MPKGMHERKGETPKQMNKNKLVLVNKLAKESTNRYLGERKMVKGADGELRPETHMELRRRQLIELGPGGKLMADYTDVNSALQTFKPEDNTESRKMHRKIASEMSRIRRNAQMLLDNPKDLPEARREENKVALKQVVTLIGPKERIIMDTPEGPKEINRTRMGVGLAILRTKRPPKAKPKE